MAVQASARWYQNLRRWSRFGAEFGQVLVPESKAVYDLRFALHRYVDSGQVHPLVGFGWFDYGGVSG